MLQPGQRGVWGGDGMSASLCSPGGAGWGLQCTVPKAAGPRAAHAREVIKWDGQPKPGLATGSKCNVQRFFFFSPLSLVGKLQSQLSHSINSPWAF